MTLYDLKDVFKLRTRYVTDKADGIDISNDVACIPDELAKEILCLEVKRVGDEMIVLVHHKDYELAMSIYDLDDLDIEYAHASDEAKLKICKLLGYDRILTLAEFEKTECGEYVGRQIDSIISFDKLDRMYRKGQR